MLEKLCIIRYWSQLTVDILQDIEVMESLFITNKEVLEIHRNQHGNLEENASSTNAVLDDICKQRNVIWDYNDKIFNRLTKIRLLAKKRQEMRKSSVQTIEKWESETFVKLLKHEPAVANQEAGSAKTWWKTVLSD